MSLHASMTPKTIFKRMNRDQSSGEPLSLRSQLNAAYTCQMMKARAVRSSRNPKDVAMRECAEAQMADIAEQLTILDAIELGFICPILNDKEIAEWQS